MEYIFTGMPHNTQDYGKSWASTNGGRLYTVSEKRDLYTFAYNLGIY